MVDHNAARLERARAGGPCVNGRDHGPAVKGGRCEVCWDRKRRSEQMIYRYGHVRCEDCMRSPPGDDARGFRVACKACGMLVCLTCLDRSHRAPHMPPVPIVVGLRVRVEGADGAWEACEVTGVTAVDFTFRALSDGATGRCWIGKSIGLWEVAT